MVNDDEVCFHSCPTIARKVGGMEHEELMNSGIPFGFGLLAIFQGSYQYLMDAYGPYAASAVCPAIPLS